MGMCDLAEIGDKLIDSQLPQCEREGRKDRERCRFKIQQIESIEEDAATREHCHGTVVHVWETTGKNPNRVTGDVQNRIIGEEQRLEQSNAQEERKTDREKNS